MKSTRLRMWWFAVLLVGAVGCSTVHNVYRHPLANLSAAQTVAVLPYLDLTGNSRAVTMVRESVIIELMKKPSLKLVPESAILAYVNANNITSGEMLTTSQITQIREQFNADIILYGTIQIYNEGKPEIDVVSKIIDTQTGLTIWITDIGLVGRTELPTFGLGETASYKRLIWQLAEQTVADMGI